MSSTQTNLKMQPQQQLGIEELREFIENEADLLDSRRYGDWYNLFAEDGVYWVPAKKGQESWLTHVSLFYDDKHTLKTRVQRLDHPMTHCQEPQSTCVRVLSNFKLDAVTDDGSEYRVSSKFIMLEDRHGKDQRLFGGRCIHILRYRENRLEIVRKQVELTNCDQSFPSLSQPF